MPHILDPKLIDISVLRRFTSKIDICSDDECWLWKGGRDLQGYGVFYFMNRSVRSSRMAYLIKYGKIPLYNEIGQRIFVLHKCDNSSCVNPNHLYLGTNTDNMNDAYKRGQKRMTKEVIGKGIFSSAKFYAMDIRRIRKLKIIRSICPKRYKHSCEYVAKIFKTTSMTIWKIWNSNEYPCRDGYFV
ncbi:HNH endonuclease [candidate division WOR-3 bacterium]|nr:HNH endonuclease [candidate division WOR-3 bacterium]